MKVKIISFLLALFMTATLISCSDKDENTVPEQSGDILYYFVGGHLVGSLEDGRFISATDREKDYSNKDRYRLYTIAELFSEKYLRFDIDSADAEVNEASIYTRQGPGGFDEDVTDRFTPYAIRTTDYGNVVIPIPCDFSGGMTDVYAPTYGFYVNMAKELKPDTDYPALTTNSNKVSLPDGLSWDCGFTQRDENEVLRILSDNGVSQRDIDFFSAAGDFDSDGLTETVVFANTARDAEGFLMLTPDTGASFSMILLRDNDESFETVYSRIEKGTSDVTSNFYTIPLGIFDLDADGTYEICARTMEWEWGETFVLARDDARGWHIAMSADYGT